MRTGEVCTASSGPVDDSTYLYSQFGSPTPAACTRASTSPTSGLEFRLAVGARTGRSCPTRRPPSPRGRGLAHWAVRGDPAHLHLHHGLVAGPVPRGPRRVRRPARHPTPRRLLPRGPRRRTSTPTRFTVTKQGFELFEVGSDAVPRSASTTSSSCRSSTPARWRTPRDHPRGLRLPLPRDRLGLRAARQHGAARARPHVVRRPRHHDVGGTTCGSTGRSPSGRRTTAAAEATRYTDGWTSFPEPAQGTGPTARDQLPSTHPIAADMVDLEAVEVNFDGITYAKGASAPPARRVGRREGVPRRADGVLLEERLGQHPPRRTCSASSSVERPRPVGLDLHAWLETSGVNLLRAARRGRRRRSPTPRWSSSRAVVASPRACRRSCARTASRSASTTARRTGSSAPPHRGRRRRREHQVPELVGLRRPDLLLLNDDDLTFAKIRLDEVSLAHGRRVLADRLARPRARSGRRRGT